MCIVVKLIATLSMQFVIFCTVSQYFRFFSAVLGYCGAPTSPLVSTWGSLLQYALQYNNVNHEVIQTEYLKIKLKRYEEFLQADIILIQFWCLFSFTYNENYKKFKQKNRDRMTLFRWPRLYVAHRGKTQQMFTQKHKNNSQDKAKSQRNGA